MTKRFSVVVVAIAIAVVVSFSFAAHSASQKALHKNDIQGVWRAVEQTINGRTLTGQNLGVGFHIYTKGFYAAVRESDIPPRPSVDASTATAAQLLSAWGPFVAQFGSYEVSGNSMTSRVIVAKNPNNMLHQQPGVTQFRLEGKTLILTSPYWGGTVVLKMVRVK